MKMKLFSMLVLLCAVTQGTWAQEVWSTWDGNAETKPSFYASYGGHTNVVVIKTAGELFYVNRYFDEKSGYDGNKKFCDLNYHLDASIDMGTSWSWIPLGRRTYTVTKYNGTFYGNGHTIRFKTWYDDDNTTKENQGLFGTINDDGKVYDTFVECDIDSDDDYVGGIAGQCWGLIQNCRVTGTVKSDDPYVGGIVGSLEGDGMVLDCYVNGTVQGNDTYVGGIAGSARSSKIERCEVNGTIKSTDEYLGGIVGTIHSTGSHVKGCKVSGKVEGVEDAKCIGGIAGSTHNTIENCWVSADVSGTWHNSSSTSKLCVGGIAGYNEEGEIKYCCMTGNVTGHDAGVGGISGSALGADSHHDHCTFYGTVTSEHSQWSVLIGNQHSVTNSTDNDMHNNDLTSDETVSSYLNGIDTQYGIYRYAVQYPYAINVSKAGTGTITASHERARPGQTFTLTTTFVTECQINVEGVDGWTYNETDKKGILTFDMPKRDVNIKVVFTTASWLNHAGSESDPYSITTTADWNDFVNVVNGGYTFSGQFVKLGNDVSVSTMAGTSDAKSFQGTFDGDGHTLTFNNGTAETPFSEQYCAPFRHVKNAVMKNLHVDGTIYTSAKKAAGIVGESHGALTLAGCISSISIHSSVSGDGTHGGLVSTLSGRGNTILIDGCVFDGSFATTNGTNNCGGFIGWGGYNKPTIKNSLLKPSSVAANMLGSNFARWYTGDGGIYEPTITNCYYVAVDNLPTDQGTDAVAHTTAPTNLGSEVEDYGMVKAYENGILFDGIYYVVPATISLTDNDTYTRTKDMETSSATYRKTTDRVGKFHSWLVPFDHTITATDADKFKFYKINMISNSPDPETEATDETWMFVKKMQAGDVLNANMPYLYVPLEAVTDYVFTADDNILKAKADDARITMMTAENTYTLYATYGPTTATAQAPFYYMNINGNLSLGNDGTVTVGSFRWIMRVESKFGSGSSAAYARRIIIYDGESETTGVNEVRASDGVSADSWYSLDGRKLQGKPSRAGVYIYNGVKVVIK